MIRERALKVVLVIVGLLFVASVYGLMKLREEETLQMMLSIYGTLGVFLLLASRNPSANRSLIAFTAPAERFPDRDQHFNIVITITATGFEYVRFVSGHGFSRAVIRRRRPASAAAYGDSHPTCRS